MQTAIRVEPLNSWTSDPSSDLYFRLKTWFISAAETVSKGCIFHHSGRCSSLTESALTRKTMRHSQCWGKKRGKTAHLILVWDEFKTRRARTVTEMFSKWEGEAERLRKQIVMFWLQLLSAYFFWLPCQFKWYQIQVTSWNRYNQSSKREKEKTWAVIQDSESLQCEYSFRVESLLCQ